LTGSVRELGEVLSTLPAPGDSPDSQIRFSLLVATECGARELGARIDLPNATVRAMRASRAAATQPANEAPAVAAPPELPGDAALGESAREDGVAEIESL
jgi:hypothetical protein